MWGLLLQEMDLKIEYRPGKENRNADTLFHIPPETEEPVC